MAEDGDRVDPVVTELSRYKSLLKVQVRENERLHSVIDATANHWLALQHNHPIQWEGAIDGAMEAACAEIEQLNEQIVELRGIIQQAADDVVAASYPRKMHLEWLEAARRVLAEDDHIASEDCWCKPTELEKGVFVHNSISRRGKREEGGLQ
jgi:hypothetical protein